MIIVRLFILGLLSQVAWGQCGTLVINPITKKLDCTGTGSGGSGNSFSVTFTAGATSGTINHSFGTISHTGWCINTLNELVFPTTWTVGASTDTLTFSGGLGADTTCTVTTGGGGGGGSGIANLNTLTGATQTFATGTTGTDFGIVSSGTTHTFNLPTASASNRGLLASTDFSSFLSNLRAFTAGAFNYDFTGAVVSLPAPWVANNVSNIFATNTKQTFGLSATTAGLRLTCGASPSAQATGDLVCNTTGVHGIFDGSNVNLNPFVAGSGTTFPSAPTSGNAVKWGAAFSVIDAGGIGTLTIASGISALGTGAISANTCATVVTTSATGTASTDTISWTPNVDISGITGYGVVSTDGLKVYPYPTANNVNWRVCNGTGSSITPGAVTLNWRVVR